MASAIFNPPYTSHPSQLPLPKLVTKPLLYTSLSTSQISLSSTPIVRSLTSSTNLCITPFSNWNGLRRIGLSISLRSLKTEKRRTGKGKGVFASLFGVGAPEALVIGVVALLVFGPKGLAEVAKNLGKTLRMFQPTIRELQEVSREFKSTLEKEIGLDELKNPGQGSYTSNTVRPPPDTLQNSQLTVPPQPATTTTEDSQAATTTSAGGPEDSTETVTTSDVSPENSQETATTSDVSPEDSQETAAVHAPAAVSAVENSEPTVDTTNGSQTSKAYSSEDLLKITEEQLKAVASQQQNDPSPSPDSPETEI